MIFSSISFDANPYPIEKARIIPAIKILKLLSKSEVFIPAWHKAVIMVMIRRKKNTPEPMSLPDPILNDSHKPLRISLQYPTAADLQISSWSRNDFWNILL